MGWAYHFMDLTDDEKYRRRYLLDWYGAFAQISVLLPLLVVQTYFLVTWYGKKSRSQGDRGAPSSPRLKYSNLSRKINVRRMETAFRRLSWWSGESLDMFGVHLGKNGGVFAAFAWTTWLLLLCFLQTGDGMHILDRSKARYAR
jgi:hypothetical protein